MRDSLVDAVAAKHQGFTQLKLTNKSIANDIGFGKLWGIFDENFLDTREKMKKVLKQLQFEQLFELVEQHRALPGNRRAYNRLITIINQSGTVIQKVEDKATVAKNLARLADPALSAYEAIQFAIEKRFISKSDNHEFYISKRDDFIEEFKADSIISEFRELIAENANTKIRMITALKVKPKVHLTAEVIEEEFDALERKSKKYDFLTHLFSEELKVSEVLNFYKYENVDGSFATMHKTKGTGIKDVIVVFDEYGWFSQYDFKSCFSGEKSKTQREIQSRKLLYVACSRTEANLVAVRLVHNDGELKYLKSIFPVAEELPR